MKIFTVSEEESPQVFGLFPEHDIKILPKYHSGIEADLIVFTGGNSDIHPSFYNRSAPKNGFFDKERDEYELKVFKEIRDGKLSTKKVFGICRGFQMLAVGFGGVLTYDIKQEHGRNHTSIHEIRWRNPGPLVECFLSVNSLHHQAVHNCPMNTGYKMLAYEPYTSVTEVAVWGDKYLGMQFHPELMLGQVGVEKFKIILENWVMKNISVSEITRKIDTEDLAVKAFMNSAKTSTYSSTTTSKKDW